MFDLVPGAQSPSLPAWPGPRWVKEQRVTLGEGAWWGEGLSGWMAEGEDGLLSQPGNKLHGVG